jgi:hypothetical protein
MPPTAAAATETLPPPAADPFARLRLMLAVEYTDHLGAIRPAVITKILLNGTVNLVSYGVHEGDPATDLVCKVLPNLAGGAPHRWRFYP